MLLLNTTSIDKYVNNIKFATLGPNGTSSEFVTKQLCNKLGAICQVSNFLIPMKKV